MNRFVVGAEIVPALAVAFLFSATPIEAKQCSTERPPNATSYWSYRLIDGRKCWYEGKPMLSKSLLYWPASRTAQANPRLESDVLSANRRNLLNAQASISEDARARPKPQVKPEIVDANPAPPPNGTLTPNDLLAWADNTAAMSAAPIVTILDRWPEQELPQHRIKPTSPIEEPLITSRTIMMMIIMFMALFALLFEVTFHRKRLAS
jgi:hypothetical protein